MSINKEDFVSPGHPIVVAYFIVKAFPSLTEAKKHVEGTPGFTCPAALACAEVPGYGNSVYDALAFLSRAGIDFEDAVDEAKYRWGCYDDQKFKKPDNWEAGRIQAEGVLDELTDMLSKWSL